MWAGKKTLHFNIFLVSYFNGAHDKVAATLVRLEKYQAERENQNNVPSFLENDPNGELIYKLIIKNTEFQKMKFLEPKVPRPKTGSRLASYAEPDESKLVKISPENQKSIFCHYKKW